MNLEYPSRRLMRFFLTPEAKAAMEGGATPARHAWPADFKLVAEPWWNHEHAAWCYLVWSSTFDIASLMSPVRIGNAPVFAGCDPEEGPPILLVDAVDPEESRP